MFVISLIIFSDEGICISPEDIFCYLLVAALEVYHEVFENVGLVGLEVHFQEHVVGDHNC